MDKEQNEFKLVRILNKYFPDILLETLSECANEIIQAGFVQLQAGKDGLVELPNPCDGCNHKSKIDCEYCDEAKEYAIRMAYIKKQKALDDKEKEEAVKKAIKSTSDSLVLLFESWYKDNDKPSDMVWNHIMEKIPDILKQTLEEMNK